MNQIEFKYLGVEAKIDLFKIAIPKKDKMDVQIYQNTNESLHNFIKYANEKYISVFEANNVFNVFLAHLLIKSNLMTVMVNPTVIKRYTNLKFFKDDVDIFILSNYGSDNKPELYKPRPEFEKFMDKKYDEMKEIISNKKKITNRMYAYNHGLKSDGEEAIQKDSKIKKHYDENIEKILKECDEIIEEYFNPMGMGSYH